MSRYKNCDENGFFKREMRAAVVHADASTDLGASSYEEPSGRGKDKKTPANESDAVRKLQSKLQSLESQLKNARKESGDQSSKSKKDKVSRSRTSLRAKERRDKQNRDNYRPRFQRN